MASLSHKGTAFTKICALWNSSQELSLYCSPHVRTRLQNTAQKIFIRHRFTPRFQIFNAARTVRNRFLLFTTYSLMGVCYNSYLIWLLLLRFKNNSISGTKTVANLIWFIDSPHILLSKWIFPGLQTKKQWFGLWKRQALDLIDNAQFWGPLTCIFSGRRARIQSKYIVWNMHTHTHTVKQVVMWFLKILQSSWDLIKAPLQWNFWNVRDVSIQNSWAFHTSQCCSWGRPAQQDTGLNPVC